VSVLKLGLIGDNIAASRAPDLHRGCAGVAGIDLTYDRLIPSATGQSFDAAFESAALSGFRGVNVTFPYKEQAAARVAVDPQSAAIGSINTVLFDPNGSKGFNTDHSGFIAAYRSAFGTTSPGRVLLIGAGGVGKAVAFGLVALGADEIVASDQNVAKAKALIGSLGNQVNARLSGLEALQNVDGVVNCTPLGMVGYPGSPVPVGMFPKSSWAFDAVYTEEETPFREQALQAGAAFLSGYELFFHQGVQAFEIFTGHRIDDHEALYKILRAEP